VKRILLQVEYDGTAYSGWQWQANALSVQQTLEEALALATGAPVRATGSSRTDAGVHARCQMVHFDTDSRIPADKYPFVLNTMLPDDIRVISGREVPADFHARFLSSGKTYTYRILNSRHGSAILRNYCWHVPVPLNTDAMHSALPALLGTHDFAAFQAAGGTAKTTIRTIDCAVLTRKDDLLTLTISGNAFLYNMVRIIAGTLAEIGLERLSPDAFSLALSGGTRLDLGMTAPAHGLELTEVRYPPEAFTDPASLRWHTEDPSLL